MCCFSSCDRRSATQQSILFRGRAAIAARACHYCRSTGRCPFIAAAAAECIAVSRVCDAAACIVIECRRDAAAWNHSRRIAGLF